MDPGWTPWRPASAAMWLALSTPFDWAAFLQIEDEFRALDRDDDGYLSAADLARAFDRALHTCFLARAVDAERVLPAHALPHAPQFDVSVRKFLQPPAHAARPSLQVTQTPFWHAGV